MKSKLHAFGLAAALASLSATAQESFQNRFIPADKTPWHPEAPGMPVDLASLWGNRVEGEAGTLLTVPGGFRSGLHSHTADYWAVLIEGTWLHWVPESGEGVDVRLEQGSFWTQKKIQPHQDACISKTRCVVFLFNREPYETHMLEKK